MSEAVLTPSRLLSQAKNQSANAAWVVQEWVHAIDPLRGLAALIVVVHHIIQAIPVYSQHKVIGVIGGWLGYLGVTQFFVLSGFCIHLPQAKKNIPEQNFSLNYKRFLYRRAYRLLPPHYAALVLSAIVGAFIVTPLIQPATVENFLAHIFMVHVWVGYFHSINAVFWSIAVEVHFYLCYPVYLALRRRIGSGRTVLGLLCMGLILYYIASKGLTGEPRFVLQRSFLVTWWQWALGAYLADVYVTARKGLLSKAAGFSGAQFFWAAALFLPIVLDGKFFGLNYRYWITPFICFMFLAAVVVKPLTQYLVHFLGPVGLFSYSLYLMHPVAMAIVGRIVTIDAPLFLAGASLVFSLLVAWLFYLLFERPFVFARATAVPDTRNLAV